MGVERLELSRLLRSTDFKSATPVLKLLLDKGLQILKKNGLIFSLKCRVDYLFWGQKVGPKRPQNGPSKTRSQPLTA